MPSRGAEERGTSSGPPRETSMLPSSCSLRAFARATTPHLLAALLALLLAACGGGGGGGGDAPAGSPGGKGFPGDDGFTPPTLPSNGGATLPVPLLVQEALPKNTPGASRDDAIATFGLPFRQGDVQEQSGRPALAVTGTSVWQARTLSKWPDGSVAWALLDAAADITAGQITTGLSVVSGSGASGQPNIASQTASLITLDTGPLQVQVSKTVFNLFQRVIVDSVEIVEPGASLGIVGQDLSLQPIFPTSATQVTIEENGPARAVVRADGSLAPSNGGSVIDFTCRITARRGSRNVEVTLTLRNASIGRPQHSQLEGVELSIQTDVGNFPYARLARHDGVEEGTLFPGDRCYLRQAYSSAPTDTVLGATPNYLPPIPKLNDNVLAEEGYELVFAGSTVKPLGNRNLYPANGWADLSGAAAGVTVAAKQMPYFWPGALEVAEDGEVRAGVFTSRNIAPYTFIWRQHESRTVLFGFHTGISDPDATSRMLDYPVSARAADYKHYDRARVLPYRLVSIAEQNQVYAALGLSHTVNILNDELDVTRFLYKGSPGGPNNYDSIEKRLGGEWLRQGLGGQYLNALDLALWKSEWQIPRSDDFDHADDPGASNDSLPHTDNVVADNEHRYRDGQILAYYLTGDERFKAALFDEAELLVTMPNLSHERSVYMGMRAMANVAAFTGDPGGLLLDALRSQVAYIATPLLDVTTQSSGFGWQSSPGTGDRRYYVNSTQFVSEKPSGENFQSRGFISGSLGPLGYYHAARALLADDPGDAQGSQARGRMRDLAFYTRNELYPEVANPVNRRWVYSYAATFQQVTEMSTTDFHPLLLGMAESWVDTGDPVYMQRGAQQIQGFAAHDQSGSYPDNLYEMETRLDSQHFFALYRVFLGL